MCVIVNKESLILLKSQSITISSATKCGEENLPRSPDDAADHVAVVLQNLRTKGVVGDRSLRPPRLLGDGKQSQEGKEYLTLF